MMNQKVSEIEDEVLADDCEADKTVQVLSLITHSATKLSKNHNSRNENNYKSTIIIASTFVIDV